MSSADPHPRERERLEALRRYEILDSGREQVFDDLAALAAHVCGTPIALISFVDEHRQWFKSAHGIDALEMPRDIAFCAHAILEPSGALVVPDARADARFTDNPLVTGETDVRSYTGAVLASPEGLPLGTLCVVDHEPRNPTRAQMDALGRLARQVVSQLLLRESAKRLREDIAERRHAEAELASSERLYRDLVENTQGLICAHEIDGTLRMVNEATARLLGYAREDIVGRNLRDFVPPEHRAAFGQYRMLMRRLRNYSGLLTLMRRDGRRVALAYQNFLFEAPAGPYVVGHGIDITERVKMEAVNRRFAAVLDASPDFVAIADPNGRPLYLNRAGRELSGVGPEQDIASFDIAHLHSPDAAQISLAVGLPAALAQGSWSGESSLRGRDGRDVPVSQVILAHRDASGQTEFIATIARDITEHRVLADQLLKAREEAVAASRMKSEFLANMSHEIRTPINGVVGLSTLLLETPLAVEQKEYAQGIRHSADALLAIVNDILDLSKIEAGKLQIEPIPFCLAEVVTQALEPAIVKARSKGLPIDLRLAPNLPADVVGDPVRVRQVLLNLADNAVKFTTRGGVSVEVDRDPADVSRIRFGVTDTGIGIAEGQREQIFEKFTQADSSTTRKYGGSGLGLTICRQLVELMGGDIDVESRLGDGSTFWFTLPLPAAAAARAVSAQTRVVERGAAPRLRVLLAEDNPINQTVARRFLEKAGCVVDIVPDGEAAVAKVRAERYDAVFMDCQMPGMDGYEATRRIRRMPDRAGLPIVAMTANAMRGDRERCLAAGMSDYLPKPIHPESVQAAVDRLTSPKTALPRPEESEASVPGASFDADALRGWFDGDLEAIGEVIVLLSRDLPGYVQALRAGAGAADWTRVAWTAHKIKGAVGNACARVVPAIAEAIEQAAKEGDGTRVVASCEPLDVAVRELLASLQGWGRLAATESRTPHGTGAHAS